MLLGAAAERGWATVDLERWVAMGGPQERVLIIRHDVDQHPATAVKMARIDARHAVRGTWYFRWRTCSLRAIEAIQELGGGIGFHYETLTRLALERSLAPEDISDALIAEAREELRREIEIFRSHVGPIRSICAHGDTRAAGISNQVLVKGVDPSDLGGVFDSNEALSQHGLGLWMTDRSASDGGWKEQIDPQAVLRERDDPVLCLTHPNNWCSGMSLWADRVRAAVLPAPPIDRRRPLLGMRTRRDRPPRESSVPPAG